eukprot:scaffold2799_cov159-Ochromonas_danica.AAC.33
MDYSDDDLTSTCSFLFQEGSTVFQRDTTLSSPMSTSSASSSFSSSFPSSSSTSDSITKSCDDAEDRSSSNDEEGLLLPSSKRPKRSYDKVQRRKYYERRKVKYNIVSRMLKCDIRRDYGVMYNNCINSGDPLIVRQFFEQYCLPSVFLTDYTSFPFTGRSTVVLQGLSAVSDYLVGIMESAPDMVGHLVESTVVRFAGQSESYVRSLVRMCATVQSAMAINQNIVITFHLDASYLISEINMTVSSEHKGDLFSFDPSSTIGIY